MKQIERNVMEKKSTSDAVQTHQNIRIPENLNGTKKRRDKGLQTEPRVPLRKTIPLKKRKVLKSSFKGVCWILLFSLLSASALLIAQYAKGVTISTTTIVIGVLVLLFALAWEIAYPLMYFITYFYDIDRDNVIIRKGILARREITLPFARITDVYVEQDILDAFLGLYNVYISSPTVESGRFAHISGVDKEGARVLRERILKGINDIQYYRE